MATIPWYETNMLQTKIKQIFFFFISSVVPISVLANSPVRDGFAGAGRSGIPREALFSNPAALSALETSWAFAYYTKSRMSDLDSGGRNLHLGVYDGQNELFKAGLSYSRESRAKSVATGITYIDQTELRVGGGRMLAKNISGGATVKYRTRRMGAEETKKIDGDAGILFPLFQDMFAGITYENIAFIDPENPTSINVGLKYSLMQSIGLLADATRITAGDFRGENAWALGVEFSMVSDFFFRAGLFKNTATQTRGKSFGISWVGPRASFDYAIKMAKDFPRERDHVLGISVQL